MTHFRNREMRTRVNTWRAREDLQRAQIADAYHVKLAVRQFCIGSDLHPAAEVTCVCDTKIRDDEVVLVRIVELDHETHRLVAHGCFQEGRRKGRVISFDALD